MTEEKRDIQLTQLWTKGEKEEIEKAAKQLSEKFGIHVPLALMVRRATLGFLREFFQKDKES